MVSPKWSGDSRVTALVREAQDNDYRVVVSALTPVEAYDTRTRNERFRCQLSRLRIEPVTDEIAFHAIDLLRGSRPSWPQIRY
jgi:hypothetical protein